MELAERADISLRGVAALECGERRAPYRDTVSKLIDALGVSHEEAAALDAAAHNGRQRAARPAIGMMNGNVPLPLTTFVGRIDAIAAIERAIEGFRAVELVGRGGIGKSRMAITLARRFEERTSHGAWLIDMSAASDENTALAKLGSVLGLATPDLDSLSALAERQMLVVLDNCDAIPVPCATIVESIVRTCPSIAVIATSTVPLRLEPETVFHVGPLEPSEAQALFIERCGHYGRQIELSDQLVAVIARVCQRLEGIPLAIELAASRAATFGAVALENTIDVWFENDSGASAGAPIRHRSLFAAIDWSYDLLPEHERVVLRRLSIFAGGFETGAAEAVCTGDSLEVDDVQALLESLAVKSFLNRSHREGETRWSFFDSIRAYAATKQNEASEGAWLAAKHARYFAAYVGDGSREFYGVSSDDWFESVRREEDNIEAALTWLTSEDVIAAARLAGSLRMHWHKTGSLRRAHDVASALLRRVDEERHPGVAAELHLTRALHFHGANAVEAAARAVDLSDRTGDQFSLTVARIYYAWALTVAGRLDEASAAIDLVAEWANADGKSLVAAMPRLAWAMRNRRGHLYMAAGKAREARDEFRAALHVAFESGDAYSVRRTEIRLADAEFALGQIEDARLILQRCLASTSATLDAINMQFARASIAAYSIVLGEPDVAAEQVRIALAISGYDPFAFNRILQHAATLLALGGRREEAARLDGYAEHVRSTTKTAITQPEMRSRNVLETSLSQDVHSADIHRLAREGSLLDENSAIELARLASVVWDRGVLR